MSNTRSSYQVYPSLTSASIKMARKAFGRKGKKMSDDEVLIALCTASNGLVDTLDFVVFAEEYYWRKHGGVSIFPESKDMVEKLLDAKFDSQHGAKSILPFECFSLTMPKGVFVDGIELPSCLVCQGDYFEYNSVFRYPFCDFLGIPYPDVTYSEDVEEGGSYISLIYQDVDQNMVMVQTGITSNSLPTILQSESYSDFQAIMKDYENMGSSLLSCENPRDATVQYSLIRLIAALGAYHSATEGERLKKGFPGFMGNPKLMGKKEDMPGQIRVFESTEALRKDVRTNSAHYRSCHFRNLKDKRYYQGKHENTPRGARWVFVSDAVVNEKVDPYTQG